MMFRVTQFLTLTGLTALEAVRQPILVLLTASCIVATAIVPILTVYQFGEEGRLARDSGLAFQLVIGLLVATYAAGSALTREIRDGTASVVLSKPVGRDLFFLSKFAGISVVILAFSVCAAIATLLAERVAEKCVGAESAIRYVTDWRTGFCLLGVPFLAYLLAAIVNFRTRRPFQSVAFGLVLALLVLALLVSGLFDRDGRLASFDFRVEWRLLPASLLIAVALLLFAALALGLSTRLSTVPSLTLCGAVLILGLMADYWFGRSAHESTTALVLYRLVPNWQHFWMSDALGGGGRIPLEYVLRAGGYGLAYLAGLLLLGMASFRHTEMK
jgi:hypothetical protein